MKKKTAGCIWIDLENTPHVPLFMPIKKELESRKFQVVLTARDFAQTLEFLQKLGESHHDIGRQFNGGKYRKVAGILWRSFQLFVHLRRYHVLGFLSHGSRSGILAAACLRVPIITMGDYELSFTKLDNFFSTKVMRPEVTDRKVLVEGGLNLNKFVPYPGYKEQIYLSEFHPLPDFRKQIGISDDTILVVLRSPATSAHYHDSRSLEIMKTVLEHVLANPGTIIIALPRTKSEKRLIRQLAKEGAARVKFPEEILDGLNLMWYSDIVISGGGTMNREAALLEVPVYSIFTGPKGSVDRALSLDGKLQFVSSPEEVRRIKVRKRAIGNDFKPPGRDLIRFVSDVVVDTIRENSSHT
ncbi:DUF354 domain-containing protein [Candidatus Pacearchaeota archaeon]|nr:DUF354 domain-containing protein [Candidatus Pacearchaeota archaeon]